MNNKSHIRTGGKIVTSSSELQSELDAAKERIKEEIKLIFSDENPIIKQNTTSLRKKHE